MAQFSVDTQSVALPNWKFRVMWEGKFVAGVSKVSMLKRTTQVIKHREGGDPSTSYKSPGPSDFDPITLEQVVCYDSTFREWALKVWDPRAGLGAEVSLRDFRKDIRIEMYNEAGQLALAFEVSGCWVSEIAVHDLDASGNAVAIRHITLQCHGWSEVPVERPTEQSLATPVG